MFRIIEFCPLCRAESTHESPHGHTSFVRVTIGSWNAGEVCGPCAAEIGERLGGRPEMLEQLRAATPHAKRPDA